MKLKASFSVEWRSQQCLLSPINYSNHVELSNWASELDIQLGSLILMKADKLQVLQLLYLYQHLNGANLDSLSATDLILHQVWLMPGMTSFSEGVQFCWPSHKEWWLQKLVQDSMSEGVYERTQHVNEKLSAWNTRAILVDKEENLKPTDESRLTFDYSKVKEEMLRNYLKLMSKVHDYLSDSQHQTFFQMNIKHSYFNVILHSEDWHLFTFSISGIGQLQPTHMPQGSQLAGFMMTKLMNIALGSISEHQSEPFLMHSKSSDSVSITFYMNDLFSGHSDFESQFAFLQDQFFPQIEGVKLILSFKKFHLFIGHIKALKIEHHVSERVHVLLTHVEAVAKWLKSDNVKGV